MCATDDLIGSVLANNQGDEFLDATTSVPRLSWAPFVGAISTIGAQRHETVQCADWLGPISETTASGYPTDEIFICDKDLVVLLGHDPTDLHGVGET